MLSTYAYTANSLGIIYLSMILPAKLKQNYVQCMPVRPLSLTLTEICCILLEKKPKNTSAQIAKVTTNCFSLVNEVSTYTHIRSQTHILHLKGKELVLCFI